MYIVYTWLGFLVIFDTRANQDFTEKHTVHANGIKYVLYSDLVTHGEAEYICASQGGNLVKITTELLPQHKETPFSRMAALIQTSKCIWIGLSDKQNEGNWKWFDGNPAPDIKWGIASQIEYEIYKYNWDCAMICQKMPAEVPPAWVYKQEYCDSYQKSGQHAFICQQGCPNCTLVSDRNTLSHNRTVYQFQNETKIYAEAQDYCRKYGGFLAKLTLDLVEEEMKSAFCSLVIIDKGFWIGMSDIIWETRWRWFDGTYVTSVKWAETKTSWLDRFTKHTREDCGQIVHKGQCSTDSGYWEWSKHKCDKQAPFMCQFDLPIRKPARPKPAPRPKPGSVKRREEVRRERQDFRVTSAAPVLDQRTLSATMCARLCKGKCHIFNYHSKSRRCIGYANIKSLTGEPDSGWEVWKYYYI